MAYRTLVLYRDNRTEITEGDFNECIAVLDGVKLQPEVHSDVSVVQMTDSLGDMVERVILD